MKTKFVLEAADVKAIAADMGTMFICLGRQSQAFYPEEDRTEIEALIQAWRPEIWAESQS